MRRKGDDLRNEDIMVNCKQIQKMIVAFDKEQLPIKYEQMFVNHIKNCADCREEFEIYYIIDYGLNDENTDRQIKKEYQELLSKFDFKGVVGLKIKNSELKLKRIKKFEIVQKACIVISDIFLIMAMVAWFFELI